MANTLSTYSARIKWFQSNLAIVLRAALVADAICNVDRTDVKTIQNPYITHANATIQSLTGGSQGTYTPAARTVTDDTLTVSDEVIASTHVYDFESRTSNFNLTANFLEQLMYEVKEGVDSFVLNKLLSEAGSSYTTPAGGFTTAANVGVIISNCLAKIAGYQPGTLTGGPFLIVENTDLPGIVQTQITSGFSYADMALNNGFLTNLMGVDIHVVRTGTFKTATIGSLSATNSGHRMFGVKGVALYAQPRGVTYDEKPVTGKTGREIMAQATIGAHLWDAKNTLFVNITLA